MENLTLVIPAKNEKESLPIVLNELKKFNIKILVVLIKLYFSIIKFFFQCFLKSHKK